MTRYAADTNLDSERSWREIENVALTNTKVRPIVAKSDILPSPPEILPPIVQWHPREPQPNLVNQDKTSTVAALSKTECYSPYHADSRFSLYHGDAANILASLEAASVDCIVTSPPYYGQRDYGVSGQLGLEDHPQEYINRLVAVFREARRVLKPTGSLWVNLGDTYWSGKGRPHGKDPKQKARRFLRPQDKTGKLPLCRPKQLLLIPHRFAIAMQEDGWTVRNDNVWRKPRPTPDPAKDRCASSHEYVFHFVQQRRYYYDYGAVAVPSRGKAKIQAPPTVWDIPTVPSQKEHTAVFPEQLALLPIRATFPSDGVLLDPFCGSGTALSVALRHQEKGKVIGIDISLVALQEALTLCASSRMEPSEH